jgi:hypothetical protein
VEDVAEGADSRIGPSCEKCRGGSKDDWRELGPLDDAANRSLGSSCAALLELELELLAAGSLVAAAAAAALVGRRRCTLLRSSSDSGTTRPVCAGAFAVLVESREGT